MIRKSNSPQVKAITIKIEISYKVYFLAKTVTLITVETRPVVKACSIPEIIPVVTDDMVLYSTPVYAVGICCHGEVGRGVVHSLN